VDILPAGAEKFLWPEAAVDEGGGGVAQRLLGDGEAGLLLGVGQDALASDFAVDRIEEEQVAAFIAQTHVAEERLQCPSVGADFWPASFRVPLGRNFRLGDPGTIPKSKTRRKARHPYMQLTTRPRCRTFLFRHEQGAPW